MLHKAGGTPARIGAEYGQLDVLVNNPGIARGDGSGRSSETTVSTLREVFETYVFGVVTVTNAMLPLLRRAPAARIVNVSSGVGSITSMTDPQSPLFPMASVPYPASKAALNMVTAMYAKELKDTPDQGQCGQPGLLRHRPERPQRLPGPRAGRAGGSAPGHAACGRPGWPALGTPVDHGRPDEDGVLPW